MSDKTSATDIDDLFDDVPAKGDEKPPVTAAERKTKRDGKPTARTPKPRTPKAAASKADEPIDTAVNIRRLDWECECGNTNTHDLRMCGKCRTHRYR